VENTSVVPRKGREMIIALTYKRNGKAILEKG
jgi:hypothetical protein